MPIISTPPSHSQILLSVQSQALSLERNEDEARSTEQHGGSRNRRAAHRAALARRRGGRGCGGGGDLGGVRDDAFGHERRRGVEDAGGDGRERRVDGVGLGRDGAVGDVGEWHRGGELGDGVRHLCGGDDARDGLHAPRVRDLDHGGGGLGARGSRGLGAVLGRRAGVGAGGSGGGVLGCGLGGCGGGARGRVAGDGGGLGLGGLRGDLRVVGLGRDLRLRGRRLGLGGSSLRGGGLSVGSLGVGLWVRWLARVALEW